ncbi:UNVERIFIED_CONTAM: hypothetical protein Slati_2382300 [Sesamum latifolium]|uniref:Aminotransferase-like plant mobile domain-containing protein n=1 Tax=Sesamum latifolium TaxID=2727402 RepID=A0AAW2WC06_9LAMI
MVNIDEESTLNWGTIVLAYMYRELCTALQRGKTNIGGAIQLLQIWTWSRIIILAPIPSNNAADLMPTIDDPDNILPIPPYAQRIVSTNTIGYRPTDPRNWEVVYNLMENMTLQAENFDPNDTQSLRDVRSRTITYGRQMMNISSERYPSVRVGPTGTYETGPSNVYTEPGPSNVYTPAGPSNVYTEADPSNDFTPEQALKLLRRHEDILGYHQSHLKART